MESENLKQKQFEARVVFIEFIIIVVIFFLVSHLNYLGGSY